MTVTAIQIGLDPEVIDYASPDFAQFPGLSKEKLRAANAANVAALRAAATNRVAADALLHVFVDQVAPALSAVAPDHAAERAALVGSQLLGLAVARYILGVPPLAGMDDDLLIEWLRPVLAHYLADPAP